MNRHSNRKQKAAWAALATAAALCLALAPAASAVDIADVRAGAGGLDFVPQVEHGGFVLTVSGPEGFHHRAEFGAGESPSFSIFEQGGGVLPDGVYSYELTVVPSATQRRDAFEANHVQKKTGGVQARIQSGAFSIVAGSVVAGGELEPGQEPAGSGPVLAPKTTILTTNDGTIINSLCVGTDCTGSETFGFDTIRLKENNTRIKFEDTSSISGFPSTDWQLTANDSASGGANKFSIDDISNAKTPFTIEANSPSNTLYVDSNKRIGIGTSTPVVQLHVKDGNTPTLRLEQDTSSGFTAQSYDVAANEANFFIRDNTTGSKLPFRIRPGAPTSSLDIAANGDVGIGTASPSSKLDLSGGQIEIGGHSIGERSADITDLQVSALRNTIYNIDSDNDSTNASFSVSRDGNPNLVVFVAREDGLVGVNRQTPSFPIHVGTDATNGNGAHVTVDGIWTDGSSRTNKIEIRALELDQAMAAFRELEPVRYRGRNSPSGEEYLGFIAEDVPELVAMNHRKGLSPMDLVALLTKVSQEQQNIVEEQSKEIQQLMGRVAELEREVHETAESP